MGLLRGLLAVSGLLSLVHGDASAQNELHERQLAAPAAESFLRRRAHRVAVLGSFLYIDGGEVAQLINGSNPTGNPSNPVNSTLSVDLRYAWGANTVSITSIPKPAPVTNSQTLWSFPSLNAFYIWGGETGYGALAPPDRLWKFTADGSGGGSWASELRSGPGASDAHRSSWAAFATSPDTAYVLGGYEFSWVDAAVTGLPSGYIQANPGLVSFNATSKAWTNDSTVALTPPFGTLVDASLEFVPAFVDGSAGMVVPLGGHVLEITPTTSTPVDLRDYANISIFDVTSRQWYWQATTGDIPSPRTAICSVGAQEKSSGSYEIFVFGGYNNLINATYDEVYVLSIPAFHWFKAPYAATTPRAGHACAAAPNRQMIAVGGAQLNLPWLQAWLDKDAWGNGLGVFDMSALTWSTAYNPAAAAYERPQVVSSYYSGGAKTTWTSDHMKNLFVYNASAYPSASGNSGNGTGTPGSGGSSSGGSSGSSTPIAPIVGGVVGGVVVIAVVAAIFFILRRRKQQRRIEATKSAAAAGGSEGANDGHPADDKHGGGGAEAEPFRPDAKGHELQADGAGGARAELPGQGMVPEMAGSGQAVEAYGGYVGPQHQVHEMYQPPEEARHEMYTPPPPAHEQQQLWQQHQHQQHDPHQSLYSPSSLGYTGTPSPQPNEHGFGHGAGPTPQWDQQGRHY